MKNQNKIRWIIRGLFFLILIVALGKPIYTVITNRESLSKKDFSDYKNLFNKQTQKDLQLFNTIQSKLREPESQYIYEGNYNLFITKVHISDSLDLKKAIVVKNVIPDIKKDEVYFPIRSFNSDINLKSGLIPLVENI
jgi:hypothetical protein